MTVRELEMLLYVCVVCGWVSFSLFEWLCVLVCVCACGCVCVCVCVYLCVCMCLCGSFCMADKKKDFENMVRVGIEPW